MTDPPPWDIDEDKLDCGEPEQVWQQMVGHLRWRASNSRKLVKEMRDTAQDALESADGFQQAAADFDALADALERANVTFPASVDAHPQGGDVQQAPSPMSGAVLSESEADAQKDKP